MHRMEHREDVLERKEHDLKTKIHETVQALEKFPRKNRHSAEWFEKYNQKYEELRDQSEK